MVSDLSDDDALRRLAELREQHRALDREVAALAEDGSIDQIGMMRLKKRKLVLKDRIALLEDQLNPDIIA